LRERDGPIFIAFAMHREDLVLESDLLGFGIRRWVFPAKIKKIPEPFPVMNMERHWYFA